MSYQKIKNKNSQKRMKEISESIPKKLYLSLIGTFDSLYLNSYYFYHCEYLKKLVVIVHNLPQINYF